MFIVSPGITEDHNLSSLDFHFYQHGRLRKSKNSSYKGPVYIGYSSANIQSHAQVGSAEGKRALGTEGEQAVGRAMWWLLWTQCVCLPRFVGSSPNSSVMVWRTWGRAVIGAVKASS